MNRIARNLIIAAPLSLAALTMSPGAASAETPAPNPGPVIVLPAEPVDPAPKDIAVPAPQPPKDIANPVPNPDPHPAPVPDDKAPVPPKDDQPEGPEVNDEITDVPDCTHGCNEDPTPDLPLDSGEGQDDEDFDFPLDGGCFEDCDLPEEPATEDTGDTEVAQFETGITTPTRVDAGLSEDDNGLNLTWLLASGALVTAGGAALVARKKAQHA